MPSTATAAPATQTEGAAFEGALPAQHRSLEMSPLRRLQVTLASLSLLLGGCAHLTATSSGTKQNQGTSMTTHSDSPPSSERTILGKNYVLDGGSTVVVHKPFGNEYYSAVVNMKGEYPGPGTIAHDIGRSEFIYVLDGSLNIKVNNDMFTVKAGENILINDGDYYYISGEGRAMVVVHDLPGGTTATERTK